MCGQRNRHVCQCVLSSTADCSSAALRPGPSAVQCACYYRHSTASATRSSVTYMDSLRILAQPRQCHPQLTLTNCAHLRAAASFNPSTMNAQYPYLPRSWQPAKCVGLGNDGTRRHSSAIDHGHATPWGASSWNGPGALQSSSLA